jgi:hypothetical protein
MDLHMEQALEQRSPPVKHCYIEIVVMIRVQLKRVVFICSTEL